MTIGDPSSQILAATPSRLADVVRPWAAVAPHRPALVDRGGSWSYGAVLEAIGAARDWLAARSVRPGDRVMMIGENCRALVAAFLGASELGAWPVLINPGLSGREVDEIRDHCQPRRILYLASQSVGARQHAERHAAASESLPILGEIAIGTLHQEARPEEDREIAALVYTSGSTGRPKGVMLTHRNLLFIARVSGQIRRLTPEDRLYGVLPMSHIVGLSVVVLGSLMHGATLHLAPRFNPAEALGAIERDGLTIMLGSPAMFVLLADYARRKGLTRVPGSRLRIISSSGAPLDPGVKAAAEALFGLPLHNGYGITECAPTIAQIRPERPRPDCSVGPLLPGVEARLIGLDGEAVAPDGVGELHVRGPNVMRGYYRAAAETAAAIDAEGWFNTRDLARFEDGNLFIVGRTKDLIIRFGFNVYPAEIEAVLNAHPQVRQSGAVGRRTADGNEEIVAFVEPPSGVAVDVPALLRHAAAQLAAYKQPSEIIVLEKLPTTPGGKILKRALAEMAAPSA
jgi:acyl-CoA synthetase (AMP-forming)/AMP-acid ligase II